MNPLSSPTGSSFFEAAAGLHPQRVCNELLSFYKPQNHFCAYVQDGADIRPVWPEESYFNLYGPDFNTNEAGYWQACPSAGHSGCASLDLTEKGLASCQELCNFDVVSIAGGTCDNAADDSSQVCGSGMYCTYDNVPNQDIGGESSSNPAYGICEICPSDPEECMLKDFSSDLGLESCLQCDLECFNMKWGEMNLDIAEVTKRSANIDSSLTTSAATGHLLSYAPATRQNYSPSGTVKAPIVDCTADLAQDGAEKCTEADGAICLVEVLSPDTVYHQLAWKCEKSGGLALAYYQNLGDFGFSNDYPIPSTLQAAVSIPVVTLSYNTGSYLRKSMIGAVAEVSIVDADWHYCMASQACSKTIPCVGHHAQSYCYFLDGYHTDVTQYCNPCPEDPIDCYFPQHGGAGEWIMGQDTVESCASECAPNLRFGEKCKLCGEALDVDFSFGVDDPDDRCNFCSDKNLRYPDRVVPLFSEGQGRDVLCWEVQAFFDRIDISKDSHNCALAQNQRYICGCEEEGGTAYAGTTNVAQRQTLVWAPRITAILSFMGSLCVFIHALRTKLLRESTFHQLMILLSLSDMLGSMAYAFTTLPIPSEYYFEGAHGNEATCIAQGFFIQLGTMSAYTNCSLAAYYYLVIKQGASENALRKHRPWLFTCPIVVGLAFAFAGIPFYDNVILWCNNAATWWPDIPVAIAIVVATCVMGAVCWDVYKKENASKKWRGANARNELSGKVFWQSFWFLMAFYGTWPPYLALQYAWASGAAFSHYGFILFAGIVVPLQGFWNFFVYGRTRFLKKGLSKLPTFSSSVTQRLGSSFFSLRRRSKSNEKATGSGASRSDSNTNSGIGGTIRRLSAAITGLGLKRGQEVVPNKEKSRDKNNAGEVRPDEIKAENEEECGESGKIASGEAKVSDENVEESDPSIQEAEETMIASGETKAGNVGNSEQNTQEVEEETKIKSVHSCEIKAGNTDVETSEQNAQEAAEETSA